MRKSRWVSPTHNTNALKHKLREVGRASHWSCCCSPAQLWLGPVHKRCSGCSSLTVLMHSSPVQHISCYWVLKQGRGEVLNRPFLNGDLFGSSICTSVHWTTAFTCTNCNGSYRLSSKKSKFPTFPQQSYRIQKSCDIYTQFHFYNIVKWSFLKASLKKKKKNTNPSTTDFNDETLIILHSIIIFNVLKKNLN